MYLNQTNTTGCSLVPIGIVRGKCFLQKFFKGGSRIGFRNLWRDGGIAH